MTQNTLTPETEHNVITKHQIMESALGKNLNVDDNVAQLICEFASVLSDNITQFLTTYYR